MNDATPIEERPPHYKIGDTYEVRKVIEAHELGFNLGNVIKYVLRADKKGNAVTDLRKAITYLMFEIEKRTKKSKE